MTLTDIIPTLRLSIPDPHDPHRWPSETTITLDDVILGGRSAVAAAHRRGTRTLIAASRPAAAMASVARACDRDIIGIWVHTVTAVFAGTESPVAMLDGCVAARAAAWEEVRLIGRISVAHRHPHVVFADGHNSCATLDNPLRHSRVHAFLPEDLQVGDLLAVPALATAPQPVDSLIAGSYRRPTVRVSTVIGGHG
ncbi:hypothetical protein [Williamsia sp. CHRR-6]|uniref:hypothetical protein n=1 Tax=Williamsia sp. CHRR-6 TaxID=2835871 RepID=UPI001BDB43C3|nr:hypothetical protein [Williamsia sp. CHRR-6]MBT0567820.1 hypothetical protein [Williamsia sp. CHRR-6]